jgi:signal transduction histidine kinase
MRQFSDQSIQQRSLAVAQVIAGNLDQGASLPQGSLARTLASLRPAPDMRLYVVDRQGRLAGPQAAPGGDAAITARKGGPLPGAAADFSDDHRLLQILATGQPGSLVRPATPGGDELVTAVSPLRQRGLSLVTVSPMPALAAPLLFFQWLVACLLAAGAAAAVLMLSISLRRAMSPLAALAQEAQQLGPGGIFRPLALAGPREAQTLIDSFNRLMIRLAEQRATLREYSLQVLRSQEDERRRVSREIHDETLQEVVALVQRIELLRSQPLAGRDELVAGLDELHELAGRAVTDLRRISISLRPPILEHLGLAVALEALCDELGQALPGADVRAEVAGDERRLAPELELTVYRVAQEALTNVRRHAPGARHVVAGLGFEDWGVRLAVADDGPGFDAQDTLSLLQGGHLGIAGMLERARLFGGELGVVSACGTGTTITLRLPAPE